jgi:diadenosine tetraphosphatase ApaH/serine/threonine PP2A family protein phosphatase
MTEPAHFPADLNLEEFGFEATPWNKGPASGPDDLALYVVGDVHGRSDLLGALHGAIALSIKEGGQTGQQRPAVICYVGDYVDRGPDPLGAIDLARAPAPAGCSKIALVGNHEQFITDFLSEPTRAPLSDWVRYGGAATLAAFGLDPPRKGGDREAVAALRPGIEAALGAERLAFLSELRSAARFGGYVVVHAGIDPRRELHEQRIEDVLWIRQGFIDHPGPFPGGVAVIHGHSIMQPGVYGARVAVDGGAYASGRLTAAEIRGSKIRFLTASMAPQTRGTAVRVASEWLRPEQ